jgi:hypothetical protein
MASPTSTLPSCITTAASARLEENRIPDAIAELHVFLQEEPNGPRADAVHKAMQNLEQQPEWRAVSPTVRRV